MGKALDIHRPRKDKESRVELEPEGSRKSYLKVCRPKIGSKWPKSPIYHGFLGPKTLKYESLEP